jgi:hypothetical protein
VAASYVAEPGIGRHGFGNGFDAAEVEAQPSGTAASTRNRTSHPKKGIKVE